MKWKLLTAFSFYSLKVVIGAVILVVVAVVSTPQAFRQKRRNRLDAKEI